VDFVRRWSDSTEIAARMFILWLGLASSKFYDWRQRYGKVNEHNAWIPRDCWLEEWEKRAIIEFHDRYPLEGYRRLTFMMLDGDVVAVSPSSVWRVLHGAGRLGRGKGKPSHKGKGFQQPLGPHQHWHVDISYLNLSGTFYYLCSVLDGYSRYLVRWEIREAMTEAEVATILRLCRQDRRCGISKRTPETAGSPEPDVKHSTAERGGTTLDLSGRMFASFRLPQTPRWEPHISFDSRCSRPARPRLKRSTILLDLPCSGSPFHARNTIHLRDRIPSLSIRAERKTLVRIQADHTEVSHQSWAH